jgi:crotonobetainyl-CoA:carnitine CoA-transferase CaiB-like acyl-CoA transferase
MTSPLSGVRVLDLTRLLPGAFATLMLAELGADVIKVEDPRHGDPIRDLPPLVDGRSLYDLLLNRGKQSVAIDLREPRGRAQLDRLVGAVDVVVESFRPAAARRLGVAGDQIRARHPRVIHCAITGYGQSGPYAERPGHDLNYVSISGMLMADRPDPTQLPRMFIADVGGGAMSGVIGILAALVGCARTGEGATLDISMHDATMYWVMLPAPRAFASDGDRASGELPTFGDHACYNVYRTADGAWIALGALEAKFWSAFCEAVARPDWTSRHLTDRDDQVALIADVRALLASRSRDEWLHLFSRHDVCVTPVHPAREALRDPHLRARGVVREANGLTTIRPPFLSRAIDLAPAPALGEHTEAILGGLGV